MDRILLVFGWFTFAILVASGQNQHLHLDTIRFQASDIERRPSLRLVRRTGSVRPSISRGSSPQAKRQKSLSGFSRSDSDNSRSPSRGLTRGSTPDSLGTRRDSSALSLSRSVSRDSYGTASIRTKVDGPASISVGNSDVNDVPLFHQVSHKSWDMERLRSRASIRQPQTVAHDAYTHNAAMIVKGTRVQARLDATRGGSGYIRTKGRNGYHSVRVNPGEIASLTANAHRSRDGNVSQRAKLKAKLLGGGLLTAEGEYEDRRASLRRIDLLPLLSSSGPLSHGSERDQRLEGSPGSRPSASGSGNGQPAEDSPGRRRKGQERSGKEMSNGHFDGPSSDPRKNGGSPSRTSRGGSSKRSGSNGGSKESKSSGGSSKESKSNGNGSDSSSSDGSDSSGNGSEGHGTDGSGFDGL